MRIQGYTVRGAQACLSAASLLLAALLLGGCLGGAVTDVAPNARPQGPAQDRGVQPKAVYGKPDSGKRPLALVMLIHGGGWRGIDPIAFQLSLQTAALYNRQGYATLTVDYRAGVPGLEDVQNFYEQARKKFGPEMPICATGPSAGGHIAMMLAVWNPDLACVINLAGPTNLTTLEAQADGGPGSGLARRAFGEDLFEKYSPALHADSICARVMLLFAENDPIVPVEQGYEMAEAMPSAELIVLPPGDASFVHSTDLESGVDPTAKAEAEAEEVRFFEDAVTSPPSCPG